jgi:hypothetical protein
MGSEMRVIPRGGQNSTILYFESSFEIAFTNSA